MFKNLRWFVLGWLMINSSQIFAANHAGDFSLALNAGYEFFAAKRNIENTAVPYGVLGYNFTDQWGIEGLIGFLTTNSTNGSNNSQQIKGALYAVDGSYRFTPYQEIFQPFILAGVGVTHLNPNASSAHDEGNINAGVGADIFFYPSIAYRFEIRDFYTLIGGKNDVLAAFGVNFLWSL